MHNRHLLELCLCGGLAASANAQSCNTPCESETTAPNNTVNDAYFASTSSEYDALFCRSDIFNDFDSTNPPTTFPNGSSISDASITTVGGFDYAFGTADASRDNEDFGSVVQFAYRLETDAFALNPECPSSGDSTFGSGSNNFTDTIDIFLTSYVEVEWSLTVTEAGPSADANASIAGLNQFGNGIPLMTDDNFDNGTVTGFFADCFTGGSAINNELTVIVSTSATASSASAFSSAANGLAEVTVTVYNMDFNGDGVLDNGDVGAFVNAFLAGDPCADYTADGILDNGDIRAFTDRFLACTG